MSVNSDLIRSSVDAIRADAEAFLYDTCTVRRKTGTVVARGETRNTYTDEDVACRWINRSGSANTSAPAQVRQPQQTTHVSQYGVQLPFATEITTDDKIVFNGEVFAVVFVPQKHALMGAFVVALQLET